jgi:predicted nucleic acid-binding Zn ribbon protein
MMGLNKSRARETMRAVSLAVTLALLVAVVLSSGAEAQRGGGG